jgi:hypothetical protein
MDIVGGSLVKEILMRDLDPHIYFASSMVANWYPQIIVRLRRVRQKSSRVIDCPGFLDCGGEPLVLTVVTLSEPWFRTYYRERHGLDSQHLKPWLSLSKLSCGMRA